MMSWLVIAGIIFALLVVLFLFRYLTLLFWVYVFRRKDRNQVFKAYRRGSFFSGFLALECTVMIVTIYFLLVVVQSEGLDSTTFGLNIMLVALIPYLVTVLYKLADGVFLVNRAEAWLLGKKKPLVPRIIYAVKVWALKGTPFLLFFVLLGLLYMLDALAWRPVLLLAFVVWCVIRDFIGTYRWTLRCMPIAQTQWADMGPRIQQWAELAGVRVDEILVLSLREEDVATAAVTGLGRKTLLLGSALLRNADWRQVDAIIGHELGHIRKRHLPLYAALSLCQVLLLIGWFAFYDLRLVVFGLFLEPEQSVLIGALCLFVALLVFSILNRNIHHRAEFACDRFSVELAGDPMAMAFGLTTLVALNGTTMKMSGPTHPSAERRMKRILTKPGRFAPWGKDPVPMFVGKEVLAKGGHHYRYIVPFDQATPLQPVPPQPWSRMPQTAPSTAPQEPVRQNESTTVPQETVEQSEPIAVAKEPVELAVAPRESAEQGEPTKECPQAETLP